MEGDERGGLAARTPALSVPPSLFLPRQAADVAALPLVPPPPPAPSPALSVGERSRSRTRRISAAMSSLASVPSFVLVNGTLTANGGDGGDGASSLITRSVSFTQPTQVRQSRRWEGRGCVSSCSRHMSDGRGGARFSPTPRPPLQASLARLMTGVAEHQSAVEAAAEGGRASWVRRRSIVGADARMPEVLREVADEEAGLLMPGSGGKTLGRCVHSRGGGRCRGSLNHPASPPPINRHSISPAHAAAAVGRLYSPTVVESMRELRAEAKATAALSGEEGEGRGEARRRPRSRVRGGEGRSGGE